MAPKSEAAPLAIDFGDGPQAATVAELAAYFQLLQDAGHIDNFKMGDGEESQRLVADARALNPRWTPGTIPRLPARYPSAAAWRRKAASLRIQPRARPRAARPREHRASSRVTRAGPDDEPLPRPCAVCGTSLAGRRRHAATCSPRCRTELHRRRKRDALERRHLAALRLVKKLPPAERLDLLASVVWPMDKRLGPVAIEAAT